MARKILQRVSDVAVADDFAAPWDGWYQLVVYAFTNGHASRFSISGGEGITRTLLAAGAQILLGNVSTDTVWNAANVGAERFYASAANETYPCISVIMKLREGEVVGCTSPILAVEYVGDDPPVMVPVYADGGSTL